MHHDDMRQFIAAAVAAHRAGRRVYVGRARSVPGQDNAHRLVGKWFAEITTASGKRRSTLLSLGESERLRGALQTQ